MNLGRTFSRGYDRGATILEGVVDLPLLIFLIVGGFDLLNLIRYSSGAYSVALTAARVAAVEEPNDTSTTVPNASQLKIPVSATNDYLTTYEEDKCGAPGILDDHKRRVINLALGWSTDVFSHGIKTASNWAGPGQSANIPNPGELIVVPDTCNEKKMDWRVCVNVPQILSSPKYVCKVASSDMWVPS